MEEMCRQEKAYTKEGYLSPSSPASNTKSKKELQLE
jgi:hypothetical protein